MEKARKMKSHLLCIPRFRPTTASKKSGHRLPPISLLDRFREAVFRLIMLSALTKATTAASDGAATPRPTSRSYRHYYADSHHSEAVADCIEFIKKNASDDNRYSSASSRSGDNMTYL